MRSEIKGCGYSLFRAFSDTRDICNCFKIKFKWGSNKSLGLWEKRILRNICIGDRNVLPPHDLQTEWSDVISSFLQKGIFRQIVRGELYRFQRHSLVLITLSRFSEPDKKSACPLSSTGNQSSQACLWKTPTWRCRTWLMQLL